jgi:hypothetical protein
VKLSRERTLLLALGAICLLAQSALAVPVCRCDDMTSSAPCHSPKPSEQASCCDNGQSAGTPEGCSAGLQATCCVGTAAWATEAAVLTIGSGDLSDAPPLSVSTPAVKPVPRAVVALVVSVSPAPPGPGVWLLHSTLLN